MASYTGNTITAGTNQGRLEAQIDQSPASVGSATSVTLRLRVWFWSLFSVVDSSNTFKVGGSWPAVSESVNINHGGSGGRTLLYDRTITVSTSTAGTVKRSFSSSLTGINALPGTMAVSGSHTVAQRQDVPSKPIRPTVSNVTSSTWTGHLGSVPASNGAAITEYGWQVQNVDTGNTAGSSDTGRTVYGTNASANTRYRIRVRARNSVDWGPYSDWSVTFTTLPNGPAAPTNVVVTRQSDTQHTISWTHNGTSAAPYRSQSVQVRIYDDAGWSRWYTRAVVSAVATSYADTFTVGNRAYEWRVVARNESGESASATSMLVFTTPARPTSVSAQKLSSGAIRVSWAAGHPFSPVQYVVQGRAGSGAWLTLATVGNVGSWDHPDPDPSQVWTYRVAARASQPWTLTSAYSAVSNTVQLQTPPNAPTLLAPTGTLDRDEPFTFSWRHNAIDTTEQTAYELRYRLGGSSWTTLTGSTATSHQVPALGTSGTVEWQVRTKGAHPDWGPWAPVAAFALAAAPTVAINTPAGPVLNTSTVELLIGYHNADGSPQSQVQAELLHDGGVVETLSWTGTSDSRSFLTNLDDATDYVVRARVQAGNGLWSDWDTVQFTTDFPIPVAYQVAGVWDRDTGAVTVTADPVEEVAVYAWDGVPDESTSTRTTADGTVTNLFTNPDMVATSGDVVVWENRFPAPVVKAGNGWSAWAGSTLSLRNDEDWPYGRVTKTNIAGTPYVDNAHSSDVVGLNEITIGVDIRSNTAQMLVRVWAQFFDGSGSQIGASQETAPVYAGEWETIRLSASVPATATTVRFLVLGTNRPEGESFDFRNVRVAQVLPPWFDPDGQSPDPDLIPQPRPGGGSQLVGKRVAGLSSVGGDLVQRRSGAAKLINNTGDPMLVTAPGLEGHEYGNAILDGTNTPLNPVNQIIGPETLGATMNLDRLGISDDYNGPPFSGASESRVEADHLTTQRRDPNTNKWVTLAENMDPQTSITDPTPALGDVEYRAISHTTLPSSNTGPVTMVPWVHDHRGDPIYVSGGPGFNQVCRIRGNQVTDDPEIYEVGHHFEGRSKRVAFFDATHEDNTITFTGNILGDASTREEWTNLLRTRNIACYRDCQGRKVYGRLRVGFSTAGGVTTLNLSVEERDHDENRIAATGGEGT